MYDFVLHGDMSTTSTTSTTSTLTRRAACPRLLVTVVVDANVSVVRHDEAETFATPTRATTIYTHTPSM